MFETEHIASLISPSTPRQGISYFNSFAFQSIVWQNEHTTNHLESKGPPLCKQKYGALSSVTFSVAWANSWRFHPQSHPPYPFGNSNAWFCQSDVRWYPRPVLVTYFSFSAPAHPDGTVLNEADHITIQFLYVDHQPCTFSVTFEDGTRATLQTLHCYTGQ